MKQILLAALAATAVFALTGCNNPECTTNQDCASRGANFVCVDSKCVATSGGGGNDAGTGGDAGTTGGPDSGTPSDAGTGGFDAGTPVDGGSQEPNWIALTTGTSAAPRAALFSLDGGFTFLGTVSKFPRWSANGQQVAYVDYGDNGAGGTTRDLVRVSVAAPTIPTLLVRATGGYDDFVDLEYAPGEGPVYAKVAGTAKTGLAWFNTGTMASDILTTGRSPEWNPASLSRLAYAASGVGISTVNRSGEAGTSVLHNNAGDEPKFNSNGTQIAYRQSAGTEAGFDDEIWSVNVATGDKKKVVAAIPPDGGVDATGAYVGGPGHYTAFQSWSPSSNTLVYVEARYNKPATGPVLCPDKAGCANEDPLTVSLQRVNPSTGEALGTPILVGVGTLPSISPGDRYVAFIAGGQLKIQALNSLGEPVGTVRSVAIPGSSLPTSFGDDSRPRWQPPQ